MPSAPPTTYSFLTEAVADADAAGFVSVADRTNPSHRYLTRYHGPPDTRYAFVFVDGHSYLCAPTDDGDRAAREFAGSSVLRASEQDATTPGERAAEVLEGHGSDGPVLVPQHLPHDAAVYLQQAGYDLASTDAVPTARVEKSRPELDCLAAVQDAATAGMAAVESALASAEASGRELRLDARTLTTERLRRTANAALADSGASGAGNTVVTTGSAATQRRFQGDLPVRPGSPVVVALRPRGPHGYHGFLARTFVPDTDGGWDRRAYLAATGARDAGVAELDPGAPASGVPTEIVAEARSFGFDAKTGDANGRGGESATPTVHGVGLSPVEAPDVASPGGDTLTAGQALAIGTRIVGPNAGCVWVGELAFVTDDGPVIPIEYPDTLVPDARDESVGRP